MTANAGRRSRRSRRRLDRFKFNNGNSTSATDDEAGDDSNDNSGVDQQMSESNHNTNTNPNTKKTHSKNKNSNKKRGHRNNNNNDDVSSVSGDENESHSAYSPSDHNNSNDGSETGSESASASVSDSQSGSVAEDDDDEQPPPSSSDDNETSDSEYIPGRSQAKKKKKKPKPKPRSKKKSPVRKPRKKKGVSDDESSENESIGRSKGRKRKRSDVSNAHSSDDDEEYRPAGRKRKFSDDFVMAQQQQKQQQQLRRSSRAAVQRVKTYIAADIYGSALSGIDSEEEARAVQRTTYSSVANRRKRNSKLTKTAKPKTRNDSKKQKKSVSKQEEEEEEEEDESESESGSDSDTYIEVVDENESNTENGTAVELYTFTSWLNEIVSDTECQYRTRGNTGTLRKARIYKVDYIFSIQYCDGIEMNEWSPIYEVNIEEGSLKPASKPTAQQIAHTLVLNEDKDKDKDNDNENGNETDNHNHNNNADDNEDDDIKMESDADADAHAHAGGADASANAPAHSQNVDSDVDVANANTEQNQNNSTNNNDGGSDTDTDIDTNNMNASDTENGSGSGSDTDASSSDSHWFKQLRIGDICQYFVSDEQEWKTAKIIFSNRLFFVNYHYRQSRREDEIWEYNKSDVGVGYQVPLNSELRRKLQPASHLTIEATPELPSIEEDKLKKKKKKKKKGKFIDSDESSDSNEEEEEDEEDEEDEEADELGSRGNSLSPIDMLTPKVEKILFALELPLSTVAIHSTFKHLMTPQNIQSPDETDKGHAGAEKEEKEETEEAEEKDEMKVDDNHNTHTHTHATALQIVVVGDTEDDAPNGRSASADAMVHNKENSGDSNNESSKDVNMNVAQLSVPQPQPKALRTEDSILLVTDDEDEDEEEDADMEIVVGAKQRKKARAVVTKYLIKYCNKSYHQCEWKTAPELTAMDAEAKLKNFIKKAEYNLQLARQKKRILNAIHLGKYSSVQFFSESYFAIDRIIDKCADGETYSVIIGYSSSKKQWQHESYAGEDTLYLVKWRGMQYDESTWETESFLRTEPFSSRYNTEKEIALFEERQEMPFKKFLHPNKNHPNRSFFVNRPSAKTEERHTITEEAVFQGGKKLRHPYQTDGVNWLVHNWVNRIPCILADEMGLGKTVQTVTFINLLSEQYKRRGSYLIVAPLSTIGHWTREFRAWSDLNVVVYHGSQDSRERIRDLEFDWLYTSKTAPTKKALRALNRANTKFHVLVTTKEIVNADRAVLFDIWWDTIVVDEAHSLKSRSSLFYKSLRTFQSQYTHTVLLTGTPIQNNMRELWCLLHFMHPDEFDSEYDFLEKFEANIADNRMELKQLLAPRLLQRLKYLVETSLAQREEKIIWVELTLFQKKWYKALYQRSYAKLRACGAAKASLMNVSMQLRKCCNHPFLMKDVEESISPFGRTSEQEQNENLIKCSGKLVLLDKLIPKLRKEGHRVLMFSQMGRMLDILEDYLNFRELLYERLDGSVTGIARQESIDRYQRDDSIFAFLLTTKAGGVGITLTGADIVIIFDSDWNPMNDVQAIARAHRIGQTKQVTVYRLVTRNCYEEEMFRRADQKMALNKVVMGDMKDLAKGDIHTMLKTGAISMFLKDAQTDEDIKKFANADIDDILATRTEAVVHDEKNLDPDAAMFSEAVFVANKEDADINIDDEDFWEALGVGQESNGNNNDDYYDINGRHQRRVRRTRAQLQKMYRDGKGGDGGDSDAYSGNESGDGDSDGQEEFTGKTLLATLLSLLYGRWMDIYDELDKETKFELNLIDDQGHEVYDMQKKETKETKETKKTKNKKKSDAGAGAGADADADAVVAKENNINANANKNKNSDECKNGDSNSNSNSNSNNNHSNSNVKSDDSQSMVVVDDDEKDREGAQDIADEFDLHPEQLRILKTASVELIAAMLRLTKPEVREAVIRKNCETIFWNKEFRSDAIAVLAKQILDQNINLAVMNRVWREMKQAKRLQALADKAAKTAALKTLDPSGASNDAAMTSPSKTITVPTNNSSVHRTPNRKDLKKPPKIKCKMGCARSVNPNKTPQGLAYDTCCVDCAANKAKFHVGSCTARMRKEFRLRIRDEAIRQYLKQHKPKKTKSPERKRSHKSSKHNSNDNHNSNKNSDSVLQSPSKYNVTMPKFRHIMKLLKTELKVEQSKTIMICIGNESINTGALREMLKKKTHGAVTDVFTKLDRIFSLKTLVSLRSNVDDVDLTTVKITKACPEWWQSEHDRMLIKGTVELGWGAVTQKHIQDNYEFPLIYKGLKKKPKSKKTKTTAVTSTSASGSPSSASTVSGSGAASASASASVSATTAVASPNAVNKIANAVSNVSLNGDDNKEKEAVSSPPPVLINKKRTWLPQGKKQEARLISICNSMKKTIRKQGRDLKAHVKAHKRTHLREKEKKAAKEKKKKEQKKQQKLKHKKELLLNHNCLNNYFPTKNNAAAAGGGKPKEKKNYSDIKQPLIDNKRNAFNILGNKPKKTKKSGKADAVDLTLDDSSDVNNAKTDKKKHRKHSGHGNGKERKSKKKMKSPPRASKSKSKSKSKHKSKSKSKKHKSPTRATKESSKACSVAPSASSSLAGQQKYMPRVLVRFDANGDPVMPLNITNKKQITCLGKIEPTFPFVSKNYIFPLGFSSTVSSEQSIVVSALQKNTTYTTVINKTADGKIEYQVTAADDIDHTHVVTGNSSSSAWKSVKYKQKVLVAGLRSPAKKSAESKANAENKNSSEEKNNAKEIDFNKISANGPTIVSLRNEDIRRLIECLPGASKCNQSPNKYMFRHRTVFENSENMTTEQIWNQTLLTHKNLQSVKQKLKPKTKTKAPSKSKSPKSKSNSKSKSKSKSESKSKQNSKAKPKMAAKINDSNDTTAAALAADDSQNNNSNGCEDRIVVPVPVSAQAVSNSTKTTEIATNARIEIVDLCDDEDEEVQTPTPTQTVNVNTDPNKNSNLNLNMKRKRKKPDVGVGDRDRDRGRGRETDVNANDTGNINGDEMDVVIDMQPSTKKRKMDHSYSPEMLADSNARTKTQQPTIHDMFRQK